MKLVSMERQQRVIWIMKVYRIYLLHYFLKELSGNFLLISVIFEITYGAMSFRAFLLFREKLTIRIEKSRHSEKSFATFHIVTPAMSIKRT